MENYQCDKCGGTTQNSQICANVECPNMPCCGKSVNECDCFKANIVTIDELPVEVQEKIMESIKNLNEHLHKKAKRLRRMKLVRQIMAWLLLVLNTIGAYLNLFTTDSYVFGTFNVIVVFLMLYILNGLSKIYIPRV